MAADIWLNGCVRYGIQAQELKDGMPLDTKWIDEIQIQILDENTQFTKSQDTLGGPERGEKSSPFVKSA